MSLPRCCINNGQVSRPLSSVLLLTLLLICLYATLSQAAVSPGRIPATQRPYIINHRTYYPLPTAEGYEETGIASWYGGEFHGRFTSNGETYDMHKISAAHKVLPMHTMLLVTNLENRRELVVRVNDRGPFVRGRIIDLSFGAAQQLGIIQAGTARVRVTALGEVDRVNGHRFIKPVDLQSGEYYVQIGAFTQKHNSLTLQKRFVDAGHRVEIQEAIVNKQKFYRVQVYVGQTLRAAQRSEKALLDKGYKGAFIIAR